MKLSGVVITICTLQVVLLFGYITKEVVLVRAGYRHQEYEKKIAQLEEERSTKTAQLHALQKRNDVWNTMHHEWGMQKMEPRQLHKISPRDTSHGDTSRGDAL